MKENTRSRIMTIGAIGSTFIAFFALNIFTPLIADDFGYSFMFTTGKRLSSLSDVLVSTFNYYTGWGGRFFACFLTQTVLLFDKIVFDICNAIVYVTFILLIYFHAFGSIKKINPFLFLLINGIIWFTVPSWGEDMLWLVGSFFYLWMVTLVLFFLAPYRKRNDSPAYTLNPLLSGLFFILGILAGSSNEAIGAALLVFFAVYFFLKVRAKEKIALFEILGAVGFLAGLAIVLLSPGSHYRGTTVELAKQYNSIVWFCRQVFLAAWRFFESGFVPAGLAVAAGLELRRQGKKIDRFAVLYGILGFTAFFSMIVSPEFPPRTSFSGVVFFCVMLLYLASKLTISEQIKKNIPAVYAVALIAFSFSFADAAKDILEIHTKWKHRIEYIESQKKKGNLDIEITEPIPTSTRLGNKYAARANDITTNANRWPNTSVARYFGINSIRGIDNGDEIW